MQHSKHTKNSDFGNFQFSNPLELQKLMLPNPHCAYKVFAINCSSSSSSSKKFKKGFIANVHICVYLYTHTKTKGNGTSRAKSAELSVLAAEPFDLGKVVMTSH